jgi:1-acyl-sn-glycerol-3-phosphate acyltransferase
MHSCRSGGFLLGSGWKFCRSFSRVGRPAGSAPIVRPDDGAGRPVSQQLVARDNTVQPSPASTDAGGALTRERGLCNGISPWLSPLAMVATQDLALPAWFRTIEVLGEQHLPHGGPVLLAPTHRARWDALILPHAAGRRVTGRDCRFMVTVDEMKGLQGWFLHRLGCFPVDQRRPTTASLRYAVDLLADGQQLVVFPEGRIQRDDSPIRLQQGLGRLALLAAGRGVAVPVVPVGIAYSPSRPRPGGSAALCFGEPLRVSGSGREAAQALTAALSEALQSAEQAARSALGRPVTSA